MRDTSDFRLLDDLPSDCFDMLVASFAKWLTNEYRFLYAECLGIKVNMEGSPLGDILLIDKGDILENANRHGIAVQIQWLNGLENEKLLDLLSQRNPLMLELDEYNCYWRKNYKRIHRCHFILLHRIDLRESVFICTDTYPTQQHFILPLDFIIQYGLRVLSFWNKEAPPQEINPCAILQPLILKYYRKDDIGTAADRLNWLIDQIPNFNISNEVKGYQDVDAIYIPVIWKLKNIQWSYKQFQYLLDFLDMKQTANLHDYLLRVSKYWEIITNSLTLSIIRKEEIFPSGTIQENLRKVVYNEERMFEALRHICEYGYCNYYSGV